MLNLISTLTLTFVSEKKVLPLHFVIWTFHVNLFPQVLLDISFPQVSLKKKLNLRLLSARPFVGIASRLKGQKFRHCISHFPSFQLGTTSHVCSVWFAPNKDLDCVESGLAEMGGGSV